MSGQQSMQQQAVRQGYSSSALTAQPTPQARPPSQTGQVAIPGGTAIGPIQTAGRPMAQPQAPQPQQPVLNRQSSGYYNPPPPPGYQTYAPPPTPPPGGFPRATPPAQPTYQSAPAGQQYAPTAPPAAYKSRSDELIYPGMQRRDLPIAAWELNEDQRMQAEMDRIRGYEELARARNAIGQDPYAQQAYALALDRANNGGLFDDEYMDQQRGLIRNRGSLSMEAARRNLNDTLAQRGVEGGLSAYEMAQLDQSGAMGVQEQLGGFEQEARGAQAQERAQGLEQLMGLTGRDQAARSSMDQLLANVFLETERSPYDVSELLQPVRKGKNPVGGKKLYPKTRKPGDAV
jgi:hypothetical protein